MDGLFDIERDLLRALSDRLDQAPPLEPSTCLEQIEFSLLTSAWQKAIRRGDSHLAMRCALELHRRDSSYVWRRMRIIALEDVSVGDTELVAAILAIAGKRALQRAWGERRLLSMLVSDLAMSNKSRTACDLAVILPPEKIVVENWDELGSLHSFDRQTLFLRAAGWRNTASLSSHEGGRWQTIGYGNRHLRDRYLDEIDAPAAVRFIAARGSGTEALNVLLPLAHQLQGLGCEPVVMTRTPSPSWNPIGELPAYAFCMYSGPGMQALGNFLRETPWGAKFKKMGIHNARKALGYLVFYVEGGHLSKPIGVRHASLIKGWSEEVALGRFGIPASMVETLKSEMIHDLPQLNAFRRQVKVNVSP